MSAAVAAKTIQATVEQDKATIETGNAKIEISRAGKVTILSDELTTADIQHKPAIAKADGLNHFTVEKNGFSINGVKVELPATGGLVVHADGAVPVKLLTPPAIGQKMEDGSFFAGLTKDGKQQIFILPGRRKRTFNESAKALVNLNSNTKAGHADWQLGSVDLMKTVGKNLDNGYLQRIFKKNASVRFWTSDKDPHYPAHVASIQLAKGSKQHFEAKNWGRFNFLPLRLVPVPTV